MKLGKREYENKSEFLGELHIRQGAEKIVALLINEKTIDIRISFRPDPDEDPSKWIPTKKGLRFNLQEWENFRGLIKEIEKKVRTVKKIKSREQISNK